MDGWCGVDSWLELVDNVVTQQWQGRRITATTKIPEAITFSVILTSVIVASTLTTLLHGDHRCVSCWSCRRVPWPKHPGRCWVFLLLSMASHFFFLQWHLCCLPWLGGTSSSPSPPFPIGSCTVSLIARADVVAWPEVALFPPWERLLLPTLLTLGLEFLLRQPFGFFLAFPDRVLALQDGQVLPLHSPGWLGPVGCTTTAPSAALSLCLWASTSFLR